MKDEATLPTHEQWGCGFKKAYQHKGQPSNLTRDNICPDNIWSIQLKRRPKLCLFPAQFGIRELCHIENLLLKQIIVSYS